MTTQILKSEIEKTARETGRTEIEVISAMQSQLVLLGDEKSIEILAKLKRTYIKR